MDSSHPSLSNIPPFSPSSSTTQKSSMSFSALIERCRRGELAVRAVEENTISGFDPVHGFSSEYVQSQGQGRRKEQSMQHQQLRKEVEKDYGMAALVPSMLRAETY
ncbi:hypothetical protein IAR50_007079 [Cryptococcus sp. DSM 104548]